jgi:hypothetical protein
VSSLPGEPVHNKDQYRARRKATIAHRCPSAAFLTKATLVYEEVADVLGLLLDVGTLVFAVLVDVMEPLEGLNDVYVVAEVDDDVLGALVQTIGETLSGA